MMDLTLQRELAQLLATLRRGGLTQQQHQQNQPFSMVLTTAFDNWLKRPPNQGFHHDQVISLT